jgi:ketosteroid isomerase-like protein
MIRTTPFRLLLVLSIGASAISCAHPDYYNKVTNVGQGGSGYTIERVPLDKAPVTPVTQLPPGDAKVHETGVRKAESDWMEALKDRSGASLSDLLTPEFVLIGPDGNPTPKHDFVAMIKEGKLVIQSESIDEATVTEYGNAAFMTGIMKLQATNEGNDISGSYRFADTWIWTSGRWRKAASVVLLPKE